MTSLFVALLVLAACAALTAQLVWWLSNRQETGHEPPPLVIPIHAGYRRESVTREAAAPAHDFAPGAAFAPAHDFAPAADFAPATDFAPPPRVAAPPVAAPTPAFAPVNAAPIAFPPTLDHQSTETVQFRRPGDAAIQLLPARLEVLAGMPSKQEIRFVRVPGEAPEMILGRDASSSPRQVTLTSSTVSRRHARVTYANGRWLVSNLSRTNPVVVNDETLDEFEGARALADGDRIELGDVVLRFCAS